MEKLQNLLKREAVAGEYGIEIEVEGAGLKEMQTATWVTERDGSLRGNYPDQAAEFVFKKPLAFNESIKAINSLFRSQRTAGARFDFSFRTSIHVHMNMLNYTLPQIYNTIYTYFLVEDVLVEYCGASRKANRFCLTANAAEGILDIVKHIFVQGERGIDEIKRLNGDAVRYAALNLHGLRKYGSLEFRAMRGTDDIETIVNWLTALHNLKEFATKYKSVADIHDEFLHQGPKDFLKAVLGDVYEAFSIPEEEQMLNRSFSITLDLAHAVPEMKEEAAKPDDDPEKDFVMDVNNWNPQEINRRIQAEVERIHAHRNAPGFRANRLADFFPAAPIFNQVIMDEIADQPMRAPE